MNAFSQIASLLLSTFDEKSKKRRLLLASTKYMLTGEIKLVIERDKLVLIGKRHGMEVGRISVSNEYEDGSRHYTFEFPVDLEYPKETDCAITKELDELVSLVNGRILSTRIFLRRVDVRAVV